MIAALADTHTEEVFMELPLTGVVVTHLQAIKRDQVADLPDRIIVGTALQYDVPLISRDGKIRAASISTIW